MTTKEPAAIPPLPSIATNADAMIILTQDYTREQKIRAVDAHMRREAVKVLAATPAPAPGPILAWQERMDAYEGRYGRSTGRPAIVYANEEIADLRAALASRAEAQPIASIGDEDRFLKTSISARYDPDSAIGEGF